MSISSVKKYETNDDGNCFYSSVYRSLSDKQLLSRIYTIYPELKSNKEERFIKKLRRFVSDNIVEDVKQLFENFKSMDAKTFKIVIKKIGTISKVLKKYQKADKYKNEFEQDFVKDIQKVVRKNNNWVGELEVMFVNNILTNDCFVNVNIFNNYKNAAKYIVKDDDVDNSIYLLNQNEVHWIYVSN